MKHFDNARQKKHGIDRAIDKTAEKLKIEKFAINLLVRGELERRERARKGGWKHKFKLGPRTKLVHPERFKRKRRL